VSTPTRCSAPSASSAPRATWKKAAVADHHRHRADRHRQPHGRGDLRRVQGHRQLRDPPRPPHGREARLPVDPDQQEGTRREELLLKPEILQKTWILRKLLYNMDEIEAMEFILDKMKASKNNLDFFDMMRRGG
jgi:hypothetical protein